MLLPTPHLPWVAVLLPWVKNLVAVAKTKSLLWLVAKAGSSSLSEGGAKTQDCSKG